MLKKEQKIPIDDLLLDPNNPRFVRSLNEPGRIRDEEIEDQQDEILTKFNKGRLEEDEEDDVTNISSLYESMMTIGFVPIDCIVVRPLAGSRKYLVIEGNRRVSTVKIILEDYYKKVLKPREREEIQLFLDSFKYLPCMIIDTEGKSQEQIEHSVSVILGLRHHGSLLEWEPLPAAYNIFKEYMSESPKLDEFELDNNKIKAVASRLSISKGNVRMALRTYIPYLQLREQYTEVKTKHFSLIQAGVTDKYLDGSYFRIDDNSYKLDEESILKMDAVCQFATRDDKRKDQKIIIRDPKQFKLLGRLIDRRQRATHEATKDFANDLIRRVEDVKDEEMTLEQAWDELTAFENRKKWAVAVSELIDKQEKELSYDTYLGTGNDKGRKDELKETLIPLRKILDV